MISVDVPDAVQDEKQQMDTLRKGMKTLESGVNRQGVQLLVPTKIVQTQPTNATRVYKSIPGLGSAFTSSGGVVGIEASVCASNSAVDAVLVSLFIDGTETLTKGATVTSAGANVIVSLSFKKILASGSHSLDVRFMSGSGTMKVNDPIAGGVIPMSDVTIMEFAVP